jgi:glycosyltransferase involved in cell wall biosynthesis
MGTRAPGGSMRTLVIVPAFNEALNLPRLVRQLRGRTDGDICVVDDGSTDDTAAVARALGAIVLQNPFNLGIGGAVQTGYLWARDHGYQLAAQVDGDGQHDPAYLQAAFDQITTGKADVVVGSRFRDQAGFQSTFVRRLGIRYLAWLLRLHCGARISDPTSGFRVVGRKGIELFAKNYPPDYPEPEAIALAQKSGLKLVEIQVRMRAREHGRSSIGAWQTLYYLLKVSLAIVLVPSRPRRLDLGAPAA